MRHINDGPRLTLKEQVFHTGLTSDKNLRKIFHELNPDIDDYMELDYNVLDIEPIFSPKTGNSMSFITSDEKLNTKITLIVTTNQWNMNYFEFLIYSLTRYSLELSRKLKIRNPMALDLDICILYTGEAEEMKMEAEWEMGRHSKSPSQTQNFGTEIFKFRTMVFDGSEPGENEMASIFYKYWRFIQILKENQKKFPSGFESFRRTIKQCIEENIFPEIFKRKRRF